jgi:hypothetical protein
MRIKFLHTASGLGMMLMNASSCCGRSRLPVPKRLKRINPRKGFNGRSMKKVKVKVASLNHGIVEMKRFFSQ